MIHNPSRPAAMMKLSWICPSGRRSLNTDNDISGAGMASGGNSPCMSSRRESLPEGAGPGATSMAGPSSVESRDQINRSADIVAAAGARVIRGGAFKPRSSPYAFQGLGEEGLRLLREAADRNGLLVVSEVMDQTQIPLVRQYADILQVGARNMQNFNLLRELGRERSPVLLKRGISATIEELLLSAEYRSEEHTSELQSLRHLVCRLLLEKKK